MLKEILGYNPLEKKTNKPEAQATTRQWEYELLLLKCYVAAEENAAKLNELGRKGWEIAGVFPLAVTDDADCALGLVVLKRSRFS